MSNDWLEVSLENSSSSLSDLYQMGVDPSGISLKSKEEYAKSDVVKEAFKNEKGEFAENEFNDYYDAVVQSMNAYKSEDFDLSAVSNDVYWESPYSKDKKVAKNRVRLSSASDNPWENLMLQRGGGFGTLSFNKWSNPTKSEAEVAQRLEVIDGDTKKSLGYTPEDTGISNGFGFFREPIVRAVYNEDVLDENGNIVHAKGELYYDEDGLPRYETLKGRGVAGKSVLSAWDTLTKEDSFFNSLDFMDNDGVDKSVAGSVMQTAATLIPFAAAAYFSGGSSTAASVASGASKLYTGSYVIRNLIDAGGAFVKSIDSLDGEKMDSTKNINDMQGFIRSWTTGKSENAKNNFFSFENFMQLAADSVFQLKGQRMIAELPATIKAFQAYKLSGGKFNVAKEALLKSGMPKAQAERMVQQLIFNDQRGALENAGRIGSYLSTAYMALTSGTDISDTAKTLGIDDKDAAIMHLALTGALAPLFKLDLGDRLTGSMELVGYDRLQKRAIMGMGRKVANIYGKHAEKSVEAVAKKGGFINKLKDIVSISRDAANEISDGMKASKVMTLEMLRSGVGESAEELSEFGLQKGIEALYNNFNSLGYTNTKDQKKFDHSAKSLIAEALATAVGGAVGGVVFKGLDYKTISASLNDNRDFKRLILDGHGDSLREGVRKAYDKGVLPGDKNLSSSLYVGADGKLQNGVFAPAVGDDNQQKIVMDKMLQMIDVYEGMMEAHGISPLNRSVDHINSFYDNLVDTGVDTDIITTLEEQIDDIFKLYTQAKAIESNASKTGKLTDVDKGKLDAINDDIAERVKEYKRITSDESTDEYLRQGLFNQDKSINNAFRSITKDKLTKKYSDYTVYDELVQASESGDVSAKGALKKIDEEFDNYTGKSKGVVSREYREDLRNARREFEGMNDQIAKRMPEFDQYVKDVAALDGYISKLSDDPAEVIERMFMPSVDDMNNMGGLNAIVRLRDKFVLDLEGIRDSVSKSVYVPEYVFANVERMLKSVNNKLSNIFSSRNMLSVTQNAENVVNKVIAQDKGIMPAEAVRLAIELKSKIDGGSISTMDTKDAIVMLLDSISEIRNEIRGKTDADSELSRLRIEAIDKAKAEASRKADEEIAKLSSMERDDAISYIFNLIPDSDYEAIVLSDPYAGIATIDLAKDIFKVFSGDEDADLVIGGTYGDYEENYVDSGYPGFKKDDIRETIFAKILDEELEDTGLNRFQAESIYSIYKINGIEIERNGVSYVSDIYEEINSYNKAQEILDSIISTKIEKSTSPLSDILSPFYKFLTQTEDTILATGAEDFSNQNVDFNNQLRGVFEDLDKIRALVISIVRINPLVNNFRESHKDILPDSLKNERFVSINDTKNVTYLLDEIDSLTSRFQYIKRLNDYNNQNATKKLIKESKVITKLKAKTLTELLLSPEIAAVANKYSELAKLKAYISTINSNSFSELFSIVSVSENDNITDDLNNKALAQLTTVESGLFEALFDLWGTDTNARQELFDILFGSDFGDLDYLKKITLESNSFDGYNKLVYLHSILSVSMFDAYDQIIRQGGGDFIGFENNKYAPLQNQLDAAFDAYASAFGDYWLDTKVSELIASKMDYPEAAHIVNAEVFIQGPPGSGKTSATISMATSIILNKSGNKAIALAPEKSQLDVLLSDLDESGEKRISSKSNTVKEFINSLTKGGDLFDKILQIGLPKITSGNFDGLSDSDKVKYREAVNKNLFKAKDIELAIFKLLKDEGILIDEKNPSKEIIDLFNDIKLVILDEVTYNDNRILVAINAIKNAINSSRNRIDKLSLILSGDDMQMGNAPKEFGLKYNVNHQAVIKSRRLTAAIRSKFDLINEALAQVQEAEEMTASKKQDGGSPENTKFLKDTNFILKSAKHNTEGLVGFKSVNSSGKLSDSEISEVIAEIKSRQGSSLLYVVDTEADKDSAKILLNNALGDLSDVKILTPREAQSTQADYVIIDAVPITTGSKYDNLRILEFYNTMMSRAKNFGLINTRGSQNIVNFKDVNAKQAQIQNKFTDAVIDKFKTLKNNELKAIDAELSKFGTGPSLGQASMQSPTIDPVIDAENKKIKSITDGLNSIVKFSIKDINNKISFINPLDTDAVIELNAEISSQVDDLIKFINTIDESGFSIQSNTDRVKDIKSRILEAIDKYKELRDLLNSKVSDATAIEAEKDAALKIVDLVRSEIDSITYDNSMESLNEAAFKLSSAFKKIKDIKCNEVKSLIDSVKDEIINKSKDVLSKIEANKSLIDNKDDDEPKTEDKKEVNQVVDSFAPARFMAPEESKMQYKIFLDPFIFDEDIDALSQILGLEKDETITAYQSLQSFAIGGIFNQEYVDTNYKPLFYAEKTTQTGDRNDILNRYPVLKSKGKLLRLMAKVKLSNGEYAAISIATIPLGSDLWVRFDGNKYDNEDGASEYFTYEELFGERSLNNVESGKLYNIVPYSLKSVGVSNNKKDDLASLRKKYPFLYFSNPKIFSISKNHSANETWNEHQMDVFETLKSQYSGKAFSWIISDKNISDAYLNGYLKDEDLLNIYLSISYDDKVPQDISKTASFVINGETYEVQPFAIRPLMVKEYTRDFATMAYEVADLVNGLLKEKSDSTQSKNIQSRLDEMGSPFVKTGILRVLYEIHEMLQAGVSNLGNIKTANISDSMLLKLDSDMITHKAFISITERHNEYLGKNNIDALKAELEFLFSQDSGVLDNMQSAIDNGDLVIDPDDAGKNLRVKFAGMLSIFSSSEIVELINSIIEDSIINKSNYPVDETTLGDLIESIFKGGKIEKNITFTKSRGDNRLIKDVMVATGTPIIYEYGDIKPPHLEQSSKFMWNQIKKGKQQAPDNQYKSVLEDAIKSLDITKLESLDFNTISESNKNGEITNLINEAIKLRDKLKQDIIDNDLRAVNEEIKQLISNDDIDGLKSIDYDSLSAKDKSGILKQSIQEAKDIIIKAGESSVLIKNLINSIMSYDVSDKSLDDIVKFVDIAKQSEYFDKITQDAITKIKAIELYIVSEQNKLKQEDEDFANIAKANINAEIKILQDQIDNAYNLLSSGSIIEKNNIPNTKNLLTLISEFNDSEKIKKILDSKKDGLFNSWKLEYEKLFRNLNDIISKIENINEENKLQKENIEKIANLIDENLESIRTSEDATSLGIAIKSANDFVSLLPLNIPSELFDKVELLKSEIDKYTEEYNTLNSKADKDSEVLGILKDLQSLPLADDVKASAIALIGEIDADSSNQDRVVNITQETSLSDLIDILIKMNNQESEILLNKITDFLINKCY